MHKYIPLDLTWVYQPPICSFVPKQLLPCHPTLPHSYPTPWQSYWVFSSSCWDCLSRTSLFRSLWDWKVCPEWRRESSIGWTSFSNAKGNRPLFVGKSGEQVLILRISDERGGIYLVCCFGFCLILASILSLANLGLFIHLSDFRHHRTLGFPLFHSKK